jgi:hypothetical protein
MGSVFSIVIQWTTMHHVDSLPSSSASDSSSELSTIHPLIVSLIISLILFISFLLYVHLARPLVSFLPLLLVLADVDKLLVVLLALVRREPW